jgi:2,3-dihydroxybenzoate decarboxylase
MKKIALEEHFTTRGYVEHLRSRSAYPKIEMLEDGSARLHRTATTMQLLPRKLLEKLLDVGAGRIAELDRVGIDMQVLSIMGPGVEELDRTSGIELARLNNNELAEAIGRHPDRLSGFATLAYQDPKAAADELERAVKVLGLKGAKINSHVGGQYLDDRKYWVLFEAAQNLGVPIYLHPKEPPKALLQAMEPYAELTRAMWGYSVDAGLHAMRLICSGLFEAFPRLNIILGHLGEGIPFWLRRIDNRWHRMERRNTPKVPGHYFRQNFYVTTSGMFGIESFLCVYHMLGAERILFAVDYPMEEIDEGAAFIDALPICDADKEKVCSGNAQRLLGLAA